jgi:predicted transcriptional regulator
MDASHKGIAVNKIAEHLAKLESECPFIGPESGSDISIQVAKKLVRDWTETTGDTGIP